MLFEAPKLIFKATVEQSDPNIRAARTIVDTAALAGQKIPMVVASLGMLLPINVAPLVGWGPPITPLGWGYLALSAIEERINLGKPSGASPTVFIPEGDDMQVAPEYQAINQAFPLAEICQRFTEQPEPETEPTSSPEPGEEQCRLWNEI
jgi:hypothetical protein